MAIKAEVITPCSICPRNWDCQPKRWAETLPPDQSLGVARYAAELAELDPGVIIEEEGGKFFSISCLQSPDKEPGSSVGIVAEG